MVKDAPNAALPEIHDDAAFLRGDRVGGFQGIEQGSHECLGAPSPVALIEDFCPNGVGAGQGIAPIRNHECLSAWMSLPSPVPSRDPIPPFPPLAVNCGRPAGIS